MAETIENVQLNEPNTSTKPLSKDMVEKLLREKSRVTITLTIVESTTKRSEVDDGVIYHEMAACHKCFTIYKYSSTKGYTQLNKHVCARDKLRLTKWQSTLHFSNSKVGSSQSTQQPKLSQSEHQSLQMNAINAAALDSSPLSRYGNEGMKIC